MQVRLSTKGQLIIPRQIRASRGWRAGTRLRIEERGDHVALLPVLAEAGSVSLEDLIGCTGYSGPRRSLADMQAAIARGTLQHR
jgi:AbrB family looped-hinge helix DNA binding protein